MPDSRDVTETWVDRRTSTPLEDRVLREAFWELLAGQPVAIEQLRTRLKLSSDEVEELLASLQTGRSLRRDASGAVVAARGLMTSPSSHRLETERGTVFTQCSVDAVGIPAALGLAATIDDRCAYCDSPVQATVSRAGDVTVQPATAVIGMARAESWEEEGIPTVCQETNFFCSPEHARAWQTERATLPGAVVSPTEAASVGRNVWGQFAPLGNGRQ